LKPSFSTPSLRLKASLKHGGAGIGVLKAASQNQVF
jgi:hypothetical protein